jgi:hypothetical protein
VFQFPEAPRNFVSEQHGNISLGEIMAKVVARRVDFSPLVTEIPAFNPSKDLIANPGKPGDT